MSTGGRSNITSWKTEGHTDFDPARWWHSLLLKLYESLTRQDAVQRSNMIYVMAGRPERKRYGLELFRKGVAPRLLLSVGRFEVSKMAELPIPGIAELASIRDATAPGERHFFVELSAAGTNIQNARLTEWNTYGEIAGLRRFLAGEKLQRVLVVSTDVHLRRVAFTFRRIFGRSSAEFLYCPVPASLQALKKAGWWTRREDRRFVLSEAVKLAGYHVLRRYGSSSQPAAFFSKIVKTF